uniref:NADH-ubiquinone oxidoreductase chain 4L n=1 Tax=Chaetosoma scaritides TaxID=546502 RepID=B6D8W6_9CUCU|nr:NADH dehydrogenase subunit 4L [Chaetosoma scaritides]ACF35104.1 NADH dehydrogenase subunit 4L [Chaetosoma scaritides]
MMMYLIIFLFIFGALSFCMKRKHLLLMLLSLEFLVLSMYFGFMACFMNTFFEGYFCLIFLSFSVCEGALGLSLLVYMIRTHGNDYFSGFNTLW